MKEFAVIVALGLSGVAFGAFMACLTVAMSLTPKQVIAWWREWYYAPCVVVRLQDWRTK